MADLADIQQTFPDQRLFQIACGDVARITCLLAFESNDVARPRRMNNWITNAKEQAVYLCRFLHLLLFTGFMPTLFDLLPFRMWQAVSIGIYLYRVHLLPFYLRLTGFDKCADWRNPPIGSRQPAKGSPEALPFATITDMTRRDRLSRVQFGDPDFERLVAWLHERQAHISPHSQSPGNPLAHSGFPGNFLNHLTGVYKILVAWRQPQYVVRAGMFHSIYGTFDYRSSDFADLRDGRTQIRELIGDAAEEVAFAICTGDRIGLMQDLRVAMYGAKGAGSLLKSNNSGVPVPGGDGNPQPPLVGVLTEQGFPVRNHVTQQVHILPPDLFAQFVVVFCADFMDQGAAATGSFDYDLCMFQFQRFRFFNDVLRFVQPYLRVIPPVWDKYMGSRPFKEPFRDEIALLRRLWDVHLRLVMAALEDAEAAAGVGCGSVSFPAFTLAVDEQRAVEGWTEAYPWLLEPFVLLACCLEDADPKVKASKTTLTRQNCAATARTLLSDWGMLAYKKGNSVKKVLRVIDACSK